MKTIDSKKYWENRYRSGGNSGAGSYKHLATFKADIINNLIADNNINTVIDLGCGDGNQLKYFNFKNYIGYDVSETIINTCRADFLNDKSKIFKVYTNEINDQAELALSLDVIYHLVEDNIYHSYIKNLFNCSTKYVIIYADDIDKQYAPHHKSRNFTTFIKDNYPQWKLIKFIPNKYKHTPHPNGSLSDFFIYEKKMVQ